MTEIKPPAEVPQRIATILTCLAIDPRLGGVLFIDLPPAMLKHCARWLGELLSADGATPRIESLGSHDRDENLWWRPAPPAADGSFGLAYRHGPVVDPPTGEQLIVVIPDLANASLAVKRAAVTIIGADAASADRHGRHHAWRPQSRWLAACREVDVPRLSGHLLDRFAVRVRTAGLLPVRPDPDVMRAALDAADGERDVYLRLPPPVPAGHGGPMPVLAPEIVDRVVNVIGEAVPGMRRALALARVARALAAMEAASHVTPAHVQAAAAAMGIVVPEPKTPPDESKLDADGSGTARSADSSPAGDLEVVRGLDADAEDLPRIALPAAALDTAEVSLDRQDMTRVYQEDSSDALADHHSLLTPPWQRRAAARRGRGAIVGTEPASSLEDLAIVATAMEAARFQPHRRRRTGHRDSHLLLQQTDLRGFRRQGHPDAAIVFVLDHTCGEGWDWTDALLPYLRWAHVQRAAIGVVEFGHATNAHPLRAERYRAHGVTDDRLAGSLRRPAGNASPLAYALDLAVQELRRQTGQARIGSDRTWLVVVSDGRGNVPLEVSLRGRMTEPAGREGVDDALGVAMNIRYLTGVRAVVLAPPELAYYAHLPFDLAAAMGGIVAATEARR